MGGLSFGLGAMVRGAAAGLQDIQNQNEHQEDRAYLKQMRDLQQQQGQLGLKAEQQRMDLAGKAEQRAETEEAQREEEYQYGKTQRPVTERHAQLENQELGARINAANADAQWNNWLHSTQKQQMQFQLGFDQAMRRFVMSNGSDYQPLQDVYNNLYPDGHKVAFARNADGTFDIHTQMSDGKTVDQKSIPYDQVGIMAMGMRDPDKYWDNALAMKVKADDRTFELNKIAAKGQWDAQVAQIRSGNMGALRIDKTLQEQANRDWGNQGNNGMFSFDAPIKSSAANLQAWTASELARAVPGGNTLLAAQRAHAIVQQAYTKAQQDAQNGGGSPDDVATRQQALLETYVKQGLGNDVLNIQKTYGTPAAAAPGGQVGTREQFIADAKKANPNVTDEKAGAYYDAHYAGKTSAASPVAAPAPGTSDSDQHAAPATPAAAPAAQPQSMLATPPPPHFDNTPGGWRARQAYSRLADQAANDLNYSYRTGTMQQASPAKMQLALQSSNLSDHVRQQIMSALRATQGAAATAVGAPTSAATPTGSSVPAPSMGAPPAAAAPAATGGLTAPTGSGMTTGYGAGYGADTSTGSNDGDGTGTDTENDNNE